MKLISFTDRYWKGDGLFLESKSFPYRRKAKEVHDNINFDNMSLRSFTFLRNYSASLYELIGKVIKHKAKAGKHSVDLVKSLLRLQLFSLDFLEKQIDDTEMREPVGQCVKDLFCQKGFFKAGLTVSLVDEFWDLVPSRNTSEFLYYFLTYYCNVKRASMDGKLKILESSTEEKDTFLITSSIVHDFPEQDFKECQDLDNVLGHLFKVPDYKGFNYGTTNKDRSTDFWYAWIL
jgi:hypothetical protein